MEFNKTTSNPMLMGTIQLVKADPSQEHKNMFITELMKAQFMAPVLVTPEPEVDAEGKAKLVPGSKVQFPMLTAPDGKHFFMAFTDKMEFKSFKEEENAPFFALNVEEYAGMVLRKDSQAAGVVINPKSDNMILPKEMLASLMAAKIAKIKAEQEKRNGGQSQDAGTKV